MAMTTAERDRLTSLERAANALALLIKGAGSKNQLNRLLVLCQDQNRKLTDRVAALETQMAEILALVRRLQ
jgi:hypothetical protein